MAIIEFINSSNNNYKGMKRAINYIKNPLKTELHLVDEKLLEHEAIKDFQVVYATHTDEEHFHNHFIINSINAVSGQKWQLSKDQLESLKEYSDELCREYVLIIVDDAKGNQNEM